MSDKCEVKVTIITNIIEPTSKPINDVLPFIHGQTLKGYLGDLQGEYIIALNGGLVEASKHDSTYLSKDDHIIVSPVPQGGGGAKNVLRIIAIAVISFYTMGAGGMAAGSFMGMTGAAGYAAAGAAFIGGTMLVNAVLPPAMPGSASSPKSYKDSPTYGIDGAKNTSSEGIPVPLVYGDYRVAGNIISLFSENINDTQYLYMLLNAGEGQIAGIDDIEINDQPMGNFKEVNIQKRYGTPNQSSIGWFGEVTRPHNLGFKISEKWSLYTTQDEVDKVRVDFVFPRGLTTISKTSGNRESRTVKLEIQYRTYIEGQLPDDGWLMLPWVNSSGHALTGAISITEKSQTALRRSVKSDLLPEQRYDVRVRRTTKESTKSNMVDAVSVSDINEIFVEKVCYNNTALLAVRIRLTDQLNNQPKVTFLHRGLIVNKWDHAKGRWTRGPSNNPAWVAYDILTNSRYGAGIDVTQIKVDKFKEWGQWCDEQKLTFNGAIDVEGNVFDSLQPIFRAGHSKILSVGTRISVSIEKPDIPVMMFSSANIIKDTFSIDWLSKADRANEIEITYFDEKNGNKQRSVKVYDEDAINNNEPQMPSSMTLIGCVSEEQAFYEGLLALNINKYINQTVTFDAALEAIACSIGSVVYIQHDMPQWGYAGRIKGSFIGSFGQSQIKLDYDVMKAMEGVTPDTILLHSSANKRHQGYVSRSKGSAITVNYDNSYQVSRAIINGDDVAILSFKKINATTTEYVLDISSYISPNAVLELWDTDLIEERKIIDVDGEIVTVDSPFSFEPAILTSYMIGVNEKMKKKFRINGIDYNTEQTRTIRAIEYNASVFDRNIPFKASESKSALGTLQETSLSAITERLIIIGEALRPKVKISYANVSSNYKTTQVYISEDNGEYELKGDHQSSISFESEDGLNLKIKLIAMDSVGSSMGANGVKIHEYVVLGKTAPPPSVQNLKLSKEVGGIKLTWDAVNELDLAGYEIRQGYSWDGAEILSEKYGGTMMFVPIREAGEYSFMIRALDTSGNRSIEVTTVTVGLIRPERVQNFITIQHSDKIRFQWDSPKDKTVNHFYIREGKSWQSSLLVGEVSGTDFVLPVNVTGERVFWIKSVDIVGLTSNDAVFSTTSVARLEDRNMLYTRVHGRSEDSSDPLPTPEEKKLTHYINCHSLSGATAGEIQMNENVVYAEYLFPIILPYKARARNAIGLMVGSLVKNDLTWEDADFAWSSTTANMSWADYGDPEAISFRPFVAIKREAGDVGWEPKGVDYHFPLNSDMTDILKQKAPKSYRRVEYDAARFDKGVHLNPFTRINWDIKTSGDFSVVFWALIGHEATREAGFAWYAKTESGDMYLYYDRKNGRIVLTEDGRRDVIIEGFRPAIGDVGLVGISQEKNERTLRIGLADGRIVKSSIDVGHSCSMSSMGIGSPR